MTKITRWDTQKSIGVPGTLHARIKRIADGHSMSIVELIEASVDLWERWNAVKSTSANGDGGERGSTD